MKFLKEHKYFLIGLLLTSILTWPLFVAPYFSHHDDVQIIRIFEMTKCLQDLQIPCRWVPDLGGEYGYPIFNYYGPLAYYFGGLIYLSFGNLTFAAKIIFALPFIGSYIFMFLLARALWKSNLAGLISAIFYTFAPYHSVVFYVRGAMGELWALMFFPAVFWALIRLKEKINITNGLLLSLFLSLLITSHNLSTLIFLPALAIFSVFLIFNQGPEFNLKKFLSFLASFSLLGVFLASFYLLPMIVEKNLTHVDTTTWGYFSYTEHFKGLRKLFLDFSWGWGDSVREVPGGAKDGLSFQIGSIHYLVWFSLIFLSLKFRKSYKQISNIILLFSLLTLGAIFMIHPRSLFFWKLIEPLKYIQFPWRFLELVIFYVSLIAGSIVIFTAKFKWGKVLAAFLIALVVGVNFYYFRPGKFFQITDSDLIKGGQRWESGVHRAIFDFLPIYAEAPPAKSALVPYKILTGELEINNFKKGTNWIYFKADVKRHSIIRLSQYYFPDWRIFIDGKPAIIDYKNSLGLMTLILGEGPHTVEARLYDTASRTLGNLLTIMGATLYLSLLLTRFKVVRSRVIYYLRSFYK